MEWINLAHDKGWWQPVINVAIYLRIVTGR